MISTGNFYLTKYVAISHRYDLKMYDFRCFFFETPCILNKCCLEKDKCKGCHGKKTLREQKILEVRIEKGMEDGQKITFSGEADQEPGIKPGDVVIILDEKDHAVFKRRKNNLHISMEINLVEAVCGFEKHIETLDKRWLKMTSPPGEIIKPGEIKAISDEGMPVYGRSISKGSLFIKFNVVFPPNEFVTMEAIEKLKALLPPADEPIIPDDIEEYILDDIDPENSSSSNNQHHYVVSIHLGICY